MPSDTQIETEPVLGVAASVHPLTANQRRRHEDARWARHDLEVARQYRGQFVVSFMRRVVAHGHIVADVLQEALRVTGRPSEELPVCYTDDPLRDLPH